MNVRYDLLDKTNWGTGVWMSEPDHVTWIDPATNYRCVLRRNALGVWCGCVGLTSGHTLFMVTHSEQVFRFVDVHGDIEYTSFNDEEALCFAPAQKTWWIGFNAMHETDHCPGYEHIEPPKTTRRIRGKVASTGRVEYRDYDYMRREVEFLAIQLALFNEGG